MDALVTIASLLIAAACAVLLACYCERAGVRRGGPSPCWLDRELGEFNAPGDVP